MTPLSLLPKGVTPVITYHASIHVTVVGIHLVDWNWFSIFDPNFDCFLGLHPHTIRKTKAKKKRDRLIKITTNLESTVYLSPRFQTRVFAGDTSNKLTKFIISCYIRRDLLFWHKHKQKKNLEHGYRCFESKKHQTQHNKIYWRTQAADLATSFPAVGDSSIRSWTRTTTHPS